MKKHQELAKQAEERKTEIASNRNIPTDIMDQVKQLGLVKNWAATEYGGKQASVLEVTNIVREMAYYNGSLAWVVGVTCCTSLVTGFLEPAHAAALYASPDSMIGGFAAPAGVAKKVDNGLEVSGRWSWGSGITHCTHIVGGVRIVEDEQIVGTAVVFFKPEEIETIDNWNVVGLKGSHSIDYAVKNLLIPNDRWTPFPVATPTIDAPLYRFSFLGALSCAVASVGLGLAERAVAEITTFVQEKKPFGQGKTLSKQPEIQTQIAKVTANFLAAKALFQTTIQEAEQETQHGICSKETKAKIRIANAHTTKLAHEVVQEAYRLGGGYSIWETQKLEELLRDMNVVTQHGMVSAINYRTGGSVLLGNKVPEVLL